MFCDQLNDPVGRGIVVVVPVDNGSAHNRAGSSTDKAVQRPVLIEQVNNLAVALAIGNLQGGIESPRPVVGVRASPEKQCGGVVAAVEASNLQSCSKFAADSINVSPKAQKELDDLGGSL